VKSLNRRRKLVKVWPIIAIGLLLLAGFIYWDFARHREVEKYVAMTPEIPGAGVTGETPVGFAKFREVRNALTRKTAQGDVRITVVWNTDEFFKALAEAESAHDISRHGTLYHAYAEKFGFLHDFVFTIILDSSSVDLRSYLMKENALLRNDKGVEVSPWHWLEGRGSSSRHIEGVLSFPQRTKSGTPMMGHLTGEHLPGESPATFLELVLKELPGGQEVVLRWLLPLESSREQG
jgi:hypothetical protein